MNARARRPRIALVVASLEILGGHGVQAHALATHLRADGYDVELLPINPRFPRGLGGLRRYPCVRTAVNQALYLPSLARLRTFDVVHVFAASYASFLLAPAPAVVAARALGKRVVLNYHSGEAVDHLARWGVLVHPFLRMADVIAVPSGYLRGVFAAHGYEPRVIPNVVDLARFRYRERRAVRPRLLSTRNLEPHYDVANTLEAFALIRARHPEARLTIAGYGSQEPELRRIADAIGGVEFVGRVEPDGIAALYHAADVFLNSSVVDNQPLSVLEALAAGVPVVSTPTGDIPAIVRDGETGLLVPARDPGAMAKAVSALIEHPDRAARMARLGRDAVEAHTWPRVRHAWAAAYGDAA